MIGQIEMPDFPRRFGKKLHYIEKNMIPLLIDNITLGRMNGISVRILRDCFGVVLISSRESLSKRPKVIEIVLA